MQFDFDTETITPDSTNVLTIGGPGGLELPAGLTADRPPGPANGLIRFNTETNQVEGFLDNKWSALDYMTHTLIVRQNPNAGEFSSIASAVASITDATANDQYAVVVYPGLYSEPEVVVPPYVHVVGVAQSSVLIQPASAITDLFTLSEQSSLNFLYLGSIGPGMSAVKIPNPGNYVLCHKISIDTVDGYGFNITNTTGDGYVYLEYCNVTGGELGMQLECTGGSLYCNAENFYIYYSDGNVNPDHGVFVSGNVDFRASSFGLEGTLDDANGQGIHIQNGAVVQIKSGAIAGWDTGVHGANVGSAPTIKLLGVDVSGNTTWDVKIEHPGTIGTLTGVARRNFVDASAAVNFTFAYADYVNNAFVQTGDFYLGNDAATLTDATNILLDTPPIGWLSGGALSVVSGLQIQATAGLGYILNGLSRPSKITWTTGTVTIPDNAPSYIYVNSSGVISSALSRPDQYTTVLLGRAFAFGGTIIVIAPQRFNTLHLGNTLDAYLQNAIGSIFGSGCVTTEGTTPRTLNVTNGTWYYSTNTYNAIGGTPITFLDFYTVSGNLTASPETVVTNAFYAPPAASDPVAITSGYFVKHILYSGGDGASTTYFLARGAAEYATLQEAFDAPGPTPIFESSDAVIIAGIIVQGGTTNIVQILDLRPRIGGTSAASAAVTDHGDLTGLLDDDHTQYLLVNGTRAMTGALNLGTNAITNAGLINSVNIQAHASRHLPNGADPIATAAAISLTPSSTNAEGIQNTLARSDHTHQITGFQPTNATLTALAAYNTNGLLTQTAANTFTGRTVTGTTNRIAVTNGNGVAGNPTIDIASTYAGQNTITTLGTITTGTWNGTAIGTDSGGTGLTSIGTANQVLGVNTGGTALEYKTITAGTGITITPAAGSLTIASSVTGTVTSVAATQPVAGLTITGSPITTSGTLVFALANDLAAVEGLASTGIAVRTATDTWAVRSLTQPAAGITITNPAGIAGNPTFALANDLLQVESLATNGFAVRTGTDSWSTRIINGTTNRVSVTNGDGISGNATVDISSAYVGQSSITTVGTITTGTWNGSTITTGFGGTGLTTIGTSNQVLGVNQAGSALEYKTVGASSFSVNVGPSGTIAWTLLSGNRYYADIAHNLGTQNVVVQVSNTAGNDIVIPDAVTLTNASSVRVVVIGNTRTLRVVIIANGASIAAGQSTPSSILVRDEGVLISPSGFTSINFVGANVTATDEGAGVARVTIGSQILRTLTYFATSLDSPNNANWVVNALAPTVADPANSAINVRQFSNTTEQGVGLLVPVPAGATNVTFTFRGRAQTAPGAAAVVQPRLYRRALTNNGAVGAWSTAFEFSNIAIPTNAFYQYASQTVSLATLGITAGVLYQFELTRRTSGVTGGTNLAANFLLAELTVEFT